MVFIWRVASMILWKQSLMDLRTTQLHMSSPTLADWVHPRSPRCPSSFGHQSVDTRASEWADSHRSLARWVRQAQWKASNSCPSRSWYGGCSSLLLSGRSQSTHALGLGARKGMGWASPGRGREILLEDKCHVKFKD